MFILRFDNSKLLCKICTLSILASSCNQMGTATFEGAAIMVEPPVSISLVSPVSSPSLDDTPTVRISGITPGHLVKLYKDASCSQQIGEATATGSTLNITASSLADGTHQLAVTSFVDGTSSPCSGSLLEYVKGAVPATLSFGSWISPATNSGNVSIIQFSVTGASGTENVSVYTTADCSGTSIGSAAAVAGTATITSSALKIGTATEFNLYTKGSVTTTCSNLNQKYTFSCPSGYIRVPGNSSLGTTEDFCVMMYEAKDDSPNKVKSVPAGNPLVNLLVADSQSKCTNIGTRYDLISNPEWMTITRNSEAVSSNFQSGKIARGWAARSDYGDTWSNTAVAPSTDSNCLYNTAGDTCGSSGVHLYRRTLTLSNGEIIWDLSGNVYEWVDWNLTLDGIQAGPTTCSDATWVQFATVVSSDSCYSNNDLTGKDFLPSTLNADSTKGFGRFFGGSGGIAKRGGAFDGGYYSGAYTLIFEPGTWDYDHHVGFRCVYRPYK
jgi:hypothetical protein